MIRRTLALSGVAILATAGLAGPAAADSSIAALPALYMQEAGVDLDTTRGLLEIDGTVIEIKNPTGSALSLDPYTLRACNATTGLTHLVTDFEANDQVPSNGVFLVANSTYDAADGPAPHKRFDAGVDQFLDPADGGLELVDTVTGDVHSVEWGTAHTPCQVFADAPTPDTDSTLNYAVPTDTWSLNTESIGS